MDSSVEREFIKEAARTRRALQKKLRRIEKGILSKNHEIQESSRHQEIEHLGELLKANFSHIRPKMTAITVTDWQQENREVTIPLDPKLGAKEQLKAYFKRSKKLKTAKEPLERALQHLENEKNRWLERLSELDLLQEKDELIHFQKKYDICKTASSPQRKGKTEEVPSSFYTFISESGLRILVGKSAQGNDLLTFQIARGDDLWLHVHGTPGSHVVIKKRDTHPVDHEAIMDAANLALYFSKVRHLVTQEHEVALTERKYVQKRKGAPKGQVMLTEYKLVRVPLDIKRIEAIKNRVRN